MVTFSSVDGSSNEDDVRFTEDGLVSVTLKLGAEDSYADLLLKATEQLVSKAPTVQANPVSVMPSVLSSVTCFDIGPRVTVKIVNPIPTIIKANKLLPNINNYAS